MSEVNSVSAGGNLLPFLFLSSAAHFTHFRYDLDSINTTMNKFDWSKITYDYSHLPWSPTAPGRSVQQPSNYSTWSKTYYPAPGQSYRRDVIYWPSGVTHHHNKSTKSYAASSCAGGDHQHQHRPGWNGSTASGAVIHDISSKAVSHKRQFPELRSKSELFGKSHQSPPLHRQSSSATNSSSPKTPPVSNVIIFIISRDYVVII